MESFAGFSDLLYCDDLVSFLPSIWRATIQITASQISFSEDAVYSVRSTTVIPQRDGSQSNKERLTIIARASLAPTIGSSNKRIVVHGNAQGSHMMKFLPLCFTRVGTRTRSGNGSMVDRAHQAMAKDIATSGSQKFSCHVVFLSIFPQIFLLIRSKSIYFIQPDGTMLHQDFDPENSLHPAEHVAENIPGPSLPAFPFLAFPGGPSISPSSSLH